MHIFINDIINLYSYIGYYPSQTKNHDGLVAHGIVLSIVCILSYDQYNESANLHVATNYITTYIWLVIQLFWSYHNFIHDKFWGRKVLLFHGFIKGMVMTICSLQVSVTLFLSTAKELWCLTKMVNAVSILIKSPCVYCRVASAH